MKSVVRLITSVMVLILLCPAAVFVLAFIPQQQSSAKCCRPIKNFIIAPWMSTTTTTTQRSVSVEKEEEIESTIAPADVVKDVFPLASSIDLDLTQHKPLGCTVEETMDSASDHVFVTKVVPGGFAEQGGIQVGDVLVAMSGIFGDTTVVLDLGIDRIKGLVSATPEDKPLVLTVARGTDVFEKHEEALVELCSSPGGSDKEVEGCIVDFLKEGYDLGTSYDDEVEDEIKDCGDEDTECMLDSMHNLWAEELPPPTVSMDGGEQSTESAAKVKPWSSRSSPSGTYVRDPVTGEMKNIDSTDWSSSSGS